MFEVNPYFSNNSFGFPLSPNVSLTPTLKTGTGHFSETTSATADPSPPIILCSSAVTITPVSFAAFIINSSSIGLIVCMLITLAFIPSLANSSFASNAASTIIPVAIIATSFPSAKVIPLPITKL